MSQVEFLTLICAGTGALLALVAVPMWMRRVPPNVWYGFRTARTLSNEQVWYTVNQTAGRDFFTAGMVTCIGAIILFFLKNRVPYGFATMNLVLLVASVGLATIHSIYALARISKI